MLDRSRIINIVMNDSSTAIVAEPNFVLATRDTGYRSLATAIAELIDNSLQAAAKTISIHVVENPDDGLSVAVIDDGRGMDVPTLSTALQFGGTPRFNDRSGQGRFGMGLPNSSVSHARRVDVYSWRRQREVLHSYLDVDEIVKGELRQVPIPTPSELPSWVNPLLADTGTVIIWSKCDRLQDRNAAHVAKELHPALGRIFRYFLWRGTSVSVNGDPVSPVDPLFLADRTARAKRYGRPLIYRIRVPTSTTETSLVRARFAELPVARWHDLPISTKRALGIVNGAGVSVVRAGREVASSAHSHSCWRLPARPPPRPLARRCHGTVRSRRS